MSNREDRIESWIRSEEEKAQRRASVVPPSSQQIHGEEPSIGEQALVAISQWMAEHDEAPIVELAVMSTEVVLLTFSEPVELPEPFYSPDEDSPVLSDSWQIDVYDALALDGGDQLGTQMLGLVGIGNTTAGAQAFINTTRWGVFGIVGSPDWVQRALISQAMVQAAQMWSQDQHIWLVGMGETAQKLIHLMRNYHPEENFHTAETLETLDADEIGEASATIYVANSEPHTYVRFKAMGLPNAGLLTDSVVNQEAMFMSEADDGSVIVAPTDHVLYPNVVDDILEMLDVTWEQAQRLDDHAIEEAAGADYDAMLKEARRPATTDEDVDAAFAEIISHADLSDTDDSEHKPSEGPPSDGADQRQADPESAEQTSELSDAEVDGDPEAQDESTIRRTLAETSHLQVLGSVQLATEAETLQQRNAETVALLQLNGGEVTVQDISAAIWPDDEPEGRAARTRRSRLLASIRAAVDVSTETEGCWSMAELPTDLDLILQALGEADTNPDGDTADACHLIEAPLVGAGPWAEPYRHRMRDQLREALTTIEQSPQTTRRVSQAAASARERVEKH